MTRRCSRSARSGGWRSRRAADVSPDEWRTVRRYYLASLAFIDEQVGRIHRALARGLAQDTAVITPAGPRRYAGRLRAADQGVLRCVHARPAAGRGARACVRPRSSRARPQPRPLPDHRSLAGTRCDTPLEGRSWSRSAGATAHSTGPTHARRDLRQLPHGSARTCRRPRSSPCARLTRFGDGGGMLFDLQRDPQEHTNLYGHPEAAHSRPRSPTCCSTW